MTCVKFRQTLVFWLLPIAVAACAHTPTEAETADKIDKANADWGEEDDKSDEEQAPKPQDQSGRSVDNQNDYQTMPVATLPGFRFFRDGTSRVFVELSGKVKVEESAAKGLLTYHLAGVQVPERVNRMSLRTENFATPVGRVRLVQVDETNADLIIELRAQSASKTKLRSGPRGTVLSVDFPKLTKLDLAVSPGKMAVSRPDTGLKDRRTTD